jgi:hypothetical protein
MQVPCQKTVDFARKSRNIVPAELPHMPYVRHIPLVASQELLLDELLKLPVLVQHQKDGRR